MTRESAYFKEIERLLSIGYEPKHINKISGIPTSTVYRIVDKLRREARFDFDNLMEKDYLWKYQQNIENFSKTIQECNEKLVEIKIKYDELEERTLNAIDELDPKHHMTKATLLNNLINLQSARTNEMIKIVAQRDKATDMKAKVYNAGPVVHAIDEWINKTHPSNAEMPALVLDDIDDKPPELNSTNTTDIDMELSQDDLDVLKELDKDDN